MLNFCLLLVVVICFSLPAPCEWSTIAIIQDTSVNFHTPRVRVSLSRVCLCLSLSRNILSLFTVSSLPYFSSPSFSNTPVWKKQRNIVQLDRVTSKGPKKKSKKREKKSGSWIISESLLPKVCRGSRELPVTRNWRSPYFSRDELAIFFSRLSALCLFTAFLTIWRGSIEF